MCTSPETWWILTLPLIFYGSSPPLGLLQTICWVHRYSFSSSQPSIFLIHFSFCVFYYFCVSFCVYIKVKQNKPEKRLGRLFSEEWNSTPSPYTLRKTLLSRNTTVDLVQFVLKRWFEIQELDLSSDITLIWRILCGLAQC